MDCMHPSVHLGIECRLGTASDPPVFCHIPWMLINLNPYVFHFSHIQGTGRLRVYNEWSNITCKGVVECTVEQTNNDGASN